LAAAAALMTRGVVGFETVMAGVLATAAPALRAAAWGSVAGAYQAGVTWAAAGAVAALALARRWDTTAAPDGLIWPALGRLVPLALLWLAAGVGRRAHRSRAADDGAAAENPMALPARTVALALEQDVLAGAAVAAWLVILSTADSTRPGVAASWGAIA